MNKIPCIECTSELWRYIRPYLEGWNYKISINANFSIYHLLVLNFDNVLGVCDNVPIIRFDKYNRELITDVEEFLERAAKLKGFTYKRKNIMAKYIINGVEIKPGMVINLKYPEVKELISYVVFPLKYRLAVVQYGANNHYRAGYWADDVNDFYNSHKDYIEEIRDVTDIAILDGGNILWKKPKEIVITMDEIADKFGYPVEQIKIMK